MNPERYWEIPLRTIARFSERLITLEQFEVLPQFVGRLFIGYHVVLSVVLVADAGLQLLDSDVLYAAALPLMVLWGIYAFHFFLVYLPSNGLYSLYCYLRGKDVPPSHSIAISVFTLIGIITVFLLIFRRS